MVNSRQHKRAKYEDLVIAGRAAGFKVTIMPIEVRSRGMLDDTKVRGPEIIVQRGSEGHSLPLPRSDQGDSPGFT